MGDLNLFFNFLCSVRTRDSRKKELLQVCSRLVLIMRSTYERSCWSYFALSSGTRRSPDSFVALKLGRRFSGGFSSLAGRSLGGLPSMRAADWSTLHTCIQRRRPMEEPRVRSSRTKKPPAALPPASERHRLPHNKGSVRPVLRSPCRRTIN